MVDLTTFNIRMQVLQLAQAAMGGEDPPETVIARARAYLRFLKRPENGETTP
jgi:hypothetical protein